MQTEGPRLRFTWVATLAARTRDGRDARVEARCACTFANPADAESDAGARTWSVTRGRVRCDGADAAARVSRPEGAAVADLDPKVAPELVSTRLEARVCGA